MILPTNLKLSKKQKLTLRILDDPRIVDILLGGGAGGSKSVTVSLWMAIQCRDFPGIRIGLGRKELTRLKQTTVVTILREAHPLLVINEGEYFYNEQKGLIDYANGSQIQLIDLARMPSDPEYDRFGSMLFTHVVIEEAGEIVKKARDVFISRKNRFLNKKYGIVGKSISTCNPSQNFLKAEYYKPYQKLGGGGFQMWVHGNVEVDGVIKKAFRAFIQSLARDNPFLSRNYIETLRQLPATERKRLLEGNWDFADVDILIFPPQKIDLALTTDLQIGTRFIGVDIADTGGDKIILTLIESMIITEQIEIKVNKTQPIGEQIANAIIKFAQQKKIPVSNIAIDGVGVGASTRDFLKTKGWPVTLFIAGAGSAGNYKNIRGETIWNMGQAIDNGSLKIYKNLSTLEILREQLLAHEYSTEERTIVIKSKKEIKESLGVSPDYAESAYIAFWISQGRYDPKQDTSRIVV